jgi:hypothetical protein
MGESGPSGGRLGEVAHLDHALRPLPGTRASCAAGRVSLLVRAQGMAVGRPRTSPANRARGQTPGGRSRLRQFAPLSGRLDPETAFASGRAPALRWRHENSAAHFRPARCRPDSGPGPMQRLRLQSKVLADLPVQARGEDESTVNSLDPRAKRFRAADKCLQQAKLALQGTRIALADLPGSRHSALSAALESIDNALREIDTAAASLDDARLESTED